ncbi:unnamed protein product [Adineta ricciae]|uniref:Mediator complex subunit 1 n=1 Tax=Adineta ricciae TaxID=249248 RepID=A0A814B9U6_ADIRI|nr:unnamed protein product [Adineta ricciae]CAF1134643.1 unnamed protein product [Adineta ricciae]
MATTSIIMLSNASMERLYLSQPPGWNDLQRLPFAPPSQQQDGQSGSQLIRACYDKLLHHMYDINSSSPTLTMKQITEQLELAAEYCQLKTYQHDNGNVYLHSEQFYLEVTFDPSTRLPVKISIAFTNDQQSNEERFLCSRMLKALNEKQYKLFREHLNGYASLFTLTAPMMNNDKRIGHTAYTVFQQDLERLSKIETYAKLLEGFQPMCEGLPMRIQFDDQFIGNSSLPKSVRIILVPSATQHYLPIKSNIHIDEKTNTVHFDASLKSSLSATGHFALEFDSSQPSLKFLLPYIQEINRLTNITTFPSTSETFNYLSTLLRKSKSMSPYQWYISHDQSAMSIKQIPFTSVKQFLHILNLIHQQMYLTKYLDYYFNHEYDQDHMDDDSEDISLELSFLSSTVLSITCAQSYHLATFLLHMSNRNALPLLVNRAQDKEIYLTEDRQSLVKMIPQLLKEDNANPYSTTTDVDVKQTNIFPEQVTQSAAIPKLNRRLSCGPPAKPIWRRATTLRRNQPACLTLASIDSIPEKVGDNLPAEDYQENNILSEDLPDDDDDPFVKSPNSQQHQTFPHHYPQQLLPKPSLSFHPSVLSRCGSVSSTQSVSTPPIFGLSPSTPYPGGSTNPNGNVFFPLGKQVSVPEYSPVSSPITMGTFDPSAFLPASGNTSSNVMSSADQNNKGQQKKKRRRSEQSNDDFIQTLSNNPNDNRLPMQHATKLTSSGGDPNSAKRGKKPGDKNIQQQHQLARQKSAFKVTDVPSGTLLTQQSITSPDDTSNELKPLKVVIKRVGDGGNSSNDESQQQQSIKQRKKQLQQQSLSNPGGSMSSTIRKLPSNNATSGASPSVLIKSESLDMSQMNSDSSAMMALTDGIQQSPRERPRPSSSLSNPSSTSSLSSSASSQPRSVPPQPPIVLKIQRSKVYSGQDQSSSSSATAPTPTAGASNTISPSVKEVLKHRARSMPSGANINKPHVASPPLLASKLTSPSAATISNPIAAATTAAPPPPQFRIPRKSSSQEVTAKSKTEPGTISNNSSPGLSKTPLLPTPAVRPPPPPPSQIGSWQSPPTQQPSRFHQARPRSSWSQQQPSRGRTPITPPNVAAYTGGHNASLPNFSQQPRSILKKPPSNENSSTDMLYIPSADLPGLNEQRSGMNFSMPSSSTSRTTTPPGMYDDGDDDSSPQAQLVIDTSSHQPANVLLPYANVLGSSSSGMDNFDSTYENNNTNQQQQSDEPLSNLD